MGKQSMYLYLYMHAHGQANHSTLCSPLLTHLSHCHLAWTCMSPDWLLLSFFEQHEKEDTSTKQSIMRMLGWLCNFSLKSLITYNNIWTSWWSEISVSLTPSLTEWEWHWDFRFEWVTQIKSHSYKLIFMGQFCVSLKQNHRHVSCGLPMVYYYILCPGNLFYFTFYHPIVEDQADVLYLTE